jgi:putative phosphoribosyl transferase
MTEVRVKLLHDNLNGFLNIPVDSKALVIFVHGSGSGRFSVRNQHTARFFNKNGFATLLIDLLTEKEKEDDITSKKFRFDIDLLTSRLIHITNYITNNPLFKNYQIVYFSSSTGTAAAINASLNNRKIITIISRGGRVDLISPKTIEMIEIPMLFIVGEWDKPVIEYSKNVLKKIKGTKSKELVVIPGASHYFEESGKLVELSEISLQWLQVYVLGKNQTFVHRNKQKFSSSFFNKFKLNLNIRFRDRISAGRLLGEILTKYENNNKLIILGIARGGMLVADGIADKLGPILFNVILIQRLRSPRNSEETIGTIDVDKSIYLTPSTPEISKVYLNTEISFQYQEIKRKMDLYNFSYQNLKWDDKMIIIVDDGSNTGATLIAASRYIKKYHPHRLLIAVPIIPKKTLFLISKEVDSIEYLLCPENFKTVEDYYLNFDQVKDEDVLCILKKRLR